MRFQTAMLVAPRCLSRSGTFNYLISVKLRLYIAGSLCGELFMPAAMYRVHLQSSPVVYRQRVNRLRHLISQPLFRFDILRSRYGCILRLARTDRALSHLNVARVMYGIICITIN